MPPSMKRSGWTTCFRTIEPESEWSRINQHAAQGPMKISPEMFRLLSACLEYSRQSEGAFDITRRSLDEGLGIL